MSTTLAIRATRNFNGDRFPVRVGDLMQLRFTSQCDVADKIREGEEIRWGGATLHSDGYKIIYDGPTSEYAWK